jgi:predicted GH43/DUF377 family glycosyl hydrolase
MKNSLIALFAAHALLSGCSSSSGNPPLEWVKDSSSKTGLRGSVLGLGAAGDFDEKSNFTISAFKEDGIVKLYYGGADSTGDCPVINGATWRIGLAISADGLNFTRVPGDQAGHAILDVGAPGQFDDHLTYRPYVLKDGNLYRMWYNGSNHFFNCPNGELSKSRRIGYAESTDGIHFTRSYDGPGPGGSVLPLGPDGAMDAQQVGYVWVIKDNAQYKMYYSANDPGNFWRVALAVSTDARHWTKVPGNQTGGAILDLGPSGSFDVACAYEPSVVKESDSLYRMWYRGCQTAGIFGGASLGTLGYAESKDGITWVKIPQPGAGGAALGLGLTGAFDDTGITTPSVFLENDVWKMYYAAFDSNGVYMTGYATAPNR